MLFCLYIFPYWSHLYKPFTFILPDKIHLLSSILFHKMASVTLQSTLNFSSPKLNTCLFPLRGLLHVLVNSGIMQLVAFPFTAQKPGSILWLVLHLYAPGASQAFIVLPYFFTASSSLCVYTFLLVLASIIAHFNFCDSHVALLASVLDVPQLWQVFVSSFQAAIIEYYRLGDL